MLLIVQVQMPWEFTCLQVHRRDYLIPWYKRPAMGWVRGDANRGRHRAESPPETKARAIAGTTRFMPGPGELPEGDH